MPAVHQVAGGDLFHGSGCQELELPWAAQVAYLVSLYLSQQQPFISATLPAGMAAVRSRTCLTGRTGTGCPTLSSYTPHMIWRAGSGEPQWSQQAMCL
jgi:hypothetical protein